MKDACGLGWSFAHWPCVVEQLSVADSTARELLLEALDQVEPGLVLLAFGHLLVLFHIFLWDLRGVPIACSKVVEASEEGGISVDVIACHLENSWACTVSVDDLFLQLAAWISSEASIIFRQFFTIV